MRRTIPAVTAIALLALSTVPALATDTDEPVTDEMPAGESDGQRVVAPEVGLTMTFPADWRVSLPAGTRESHIRTPEGEPIYETTAIIANGGGGRWCDVDVYLDMIAPLDQHAYAYVGYLQQINGANTPMVVVDAELPAGPAFRIEVFDQDRARLRTMYLFDGPVADDGTVDRYLFTCAAPSDSPPFWEAMAESAEVFEPESEEEAPAD